MAEPLRTHSGRKETLRKLERFARVMRARRGTGESSAADVRIGQLLPAAAASWSREQWLTFGRALGRHHWWQWSELMGHAAVRAYELYGEEVAVAALDSWREAGIRSDAPIFRA